MDDIFISYARDDRETVERLERKLEEFGFRCWFDRELTIGKQFREQLVRKVEAARCVIVAWSPHSATSPWVQDEAERAMKQNKLISVLIAPCQLPQLFASQPILDLTGVLRSDFAFSQPEGWLELQRGVSAFVKPNAAASAAPMKPAKPEKQERREKPQKPAKQTESKATMSKLNETRTGGGSIPGAATVAVALVAGVLMGGGGAYLLKPPTTLPYSVATLPAEVRSAALEARSQRAQAQKNAEEALKKAKAALFHANAARAGTNPEYEARAINPDAPSPFDFYYGEKLQQAKKSLGMTNATLNNEGAPDVRGEHTVDYLGEHDGAMFGGFGVRVVNASEYMQGRFHDGVPDGPGVLIQSDRSRYEGYFDKDRQDGFAVEIGPDGLVTYEGQWKSGERDGPGVEWREGGCYFVAGAWVLGKIQNPREGRLCTPGK